MGIFFPFYISLFMHVPRNIMGLFWLSCIFAGVIVGTINYFVTLSIFKDLKQEEERTKLLERASQVDPLTGLLNRHSFNLAISEINKCKFREPLTVAFIDIDNFGKINNEYGHLRGDEILRKIADIIIHNIRSTDKAYRYGGEELVIFFHNTKPEIGENACLRLKNLIENTHFNTSAKVTVSIGLSFFGEDCGMLEEAIDRADDAMYQAKEKGKNELVVNCYNYHPI